MKVLLIGGTGLLSSSVLKHAIEKGYDLYVLNRGKNAESLPQNVTLLKADIKLKEQVLNVIQNLFFDVVVDFLSYNENDINNSLSIFNTFCGQFIFISSACAFRRDKIDGILTEDSPLGNLNWKYSTDKVICENVLKSECSKLKLNYTIARPYITYGDTRIPFGIMPSYGSHWTLIERILNEKPVFLWDSGNARVTITHVSDFAKGLVGLFGNPLAYNESFNIVGDETITWRDMIELIGKLVNKNPISINIPSEYAGLKMPEIKGMLLGDRALDAIFDNSKIKKTVPEFVCTTSLVAGIQQTLDYYKSHDYLNGLDYQWDAQIDRLVYEYLKDTQPKLLTNYRLNYVKYFKTSLIDKIRYYENRYLSRSTMGILRRFMNVLQVK